MDFLQAVEFHNPSSWFCNDITSKRKLTKILTPPRQLRLTRCKCYITININPSRNERPWRNFKQWSLIVLSWKECNNGASPWFTKIFFFFFQLSLSLVFGWIRIRICGSNSWADMNPLRRFGPLFHTFLLASFVSYLVTNSICKLFVDVLFNHNITFLSNDKNKQPFCSSSAAFIIASRTVYSRIKCETTAFEPLKLLQYILASSDANQHWYETS